MVKTATNTSVNANTIRRRGGVNNAAKRAAAQQYKFGNKTLNRSAAPQAGGAATAGDKQQQSTVYNRKWLEENDKEKVPFPEDVLSTTFGSENLVKLVAACKQATDSEVNESNRLLSDDYVYSVQITSHRAPHVPMHLSRIVLPHTLETADSDICVFVKDLKRGRKLDHEPTVKHYEQLLRGKKVDRNITVIPINQLYNEFATFELRRKLTYLYDRFLVDKAVAAHVNGFLGHKLLSKGRSAIPVDLGADNLADEIETALRKVFYKHINNGITQNVQVGRHSMSDAQIAANVAELVGQLAVIHPGGTKNVYKLHLKPNVNVSVAVPLYVDLAKPTLETPAEAGPRAITLDAAAENAAAVLENFDINKAGEVVAKPKAAKALAAADGAEEAQDDDDDADMDDSAAVVAAVQAASTPAPKPKPAAKAAAAKKVNAAAAAATVAPIAEDQLNNLILKNLKKLVPKLNAANAVQQQQQNTGRVQKNNNQGVQQQQQPQQQQQKQQRQQNNQQQQQPQQQRQQNNNQQQRQQNNQQGGGYVQQQQQVPQQQRQQNNNMGGGGGNRRNNNNNNQGGFQNNLGGGGYNNQRGGNLGGGMGGGLNNYNQRPMGAIGGGMGGGQQRGGYNNGNASGGFQNNLGSGGNWGNAGSNNDPWGQRSQF